MSEALGNEQTQIEQNLTHDLSSEHTLLLPNDETEALEQRPINRIDISPDDLHAVMDYASTYARITPGQLHQITNPEAFLDAQTARDFQNHRPNLPKLTQDEAAAIVNHMRSVGLIDKGGVVNLDQVVKEVNNNGKYELRASEPTPQASKAAKFLGKLVPKSTIREVAKQTRENIGLNQYRAESLVHSRSKQESIADNYRKKVATERQAQIIKDDTQTIAKANTRRATKVTGMAARDSFHLRAIPGAQLESQRPPEVEVPVDDSLNQGDLLSLLGELQPQAEDDARYIQQAAREVLKTLYESRDPSDTRNWEEFVAEEAEDIRETFIMRSSIAEKDLIREELSKFDKAEQVLQQQEQRQEVERLARMSPLEKYHFKLNKVLDLMDDPKYGHMFDRDRLVQLHKDIQREASPLYTAELAKINAEVDTANTRIEKANRLLPEDQQKPLEKHTSSINDIPAQKRREIIGPIDQKHTENYVGSDVPSDISELVTFARLVATGKITEPTETKSKK